MVTHMSLNVYFVYVTVPARHDAEFIGAALIKERLAACVNVLPGMMSIYEWEGQTVTDHEVAMIVKTTGDRVDSVIDRVKALHTYTCPCVVAWPITAGNLPFMEWVSKSSTGR